VSNGSSTGIGLCPMPVKIVEVTAFNCTKAGIERGSDAGSRQRRAKMKSGAIELCALSSILS